jgi:2'-5' RNA ligase
MTFARFGRFPQTLWLDPQPAAPIVELVHEVASRWPEYPPFGGEFADVVPHVTLADRRDPESLIDLVADVEPQLPLHEAVSALTLMRLLDNRWTLDAHFPFHT